LVADVFGPEKVPGFLEDLKGDLAGSDPGGDLPVRNFVLYQLSALLGPENVDAFCALRLRPPKR